MKRSRKRSFAENICKKLDISPDAVSGESRVEIRGRGEIRVSGCGKILLYTPEKIAVRLCDSVLVILGKQLLCVSFSAGEVGIEGRIYSVLYEEDER